MSETDALKDAKGFLDQYGSLIKNKHSSQLIERLITEVERLRADQSRPAVPEADAYILFFEDQERENLTFSGLVCSHCLQLFIITSFWLLGCLWHDRRKQND